MIEGLASRKLAVEILIKVDREKAFVQTVLHEALLRKPLSERDRAFVTYLVNGTPRNLSEIDRLIKDLSSKKLEKLSPALKAVLRVSLYQLLYMKNLPASAVLNTAVETARKTGHEGSARFVNGVLRSYLRGLEAESKPEGTLKKNCTAEKTETSTQAEDESSKSASLPDWVKERWQKRYSAEELEKLEEFSRSIPNLCLRTCSLAITSDGLCRILEQSGMKIERSRLMPDCLKIVDRGKSSGPVSKIPGYSEGLFTIQDESSALVAHILNPQPSDTVIDLCAAPGGKSLQIGELLQNKGRVVAVDISQKRLLLLAKERRRLGLTNIETQIADGRTYKTDRPADAVLLDAPCSGTGVLNRRSDLRLHKSDKELASLLEIQADLLENAATLLKEDGVLVYSTCSIEPEENIEQIKKFLDKHKNFRAEPLTPLLPETLISYWQTQEHWSLTETELADGYLQLLPSRHGSSGFFISRLRQDPA